MQNSPRRAAQAGLLGVAAWLLAGCSYLPTIGPSAEAVAQPPADASLPTVQIVDVDDGVARRLAAQRQQRQFSESLGAAAPATRRIGPGDSVEVTIWEAPPATLFGTGSDARAGIAGSLPTTLPEQVIDRDGAITVPFAGRVSALGLAPQALEAEIARRLRGKANQPEVLVRLTKPLSATVTVVGDVATSVRMPLTAGGERVLDALAAAGGVRQPVNKIMLQVTRGDDYVAMPLDKLIRDPRQNVPLRPGDVVTALYQPYSFTALGSTGRNEEINFEAQGISLAQALARAGGLLDNRSNPQGLFVFRYEAADAIDWPRQPVARTPEGRVPVVYRVDLRNPNSFFVMQSFAINHQDLLYVSNAPATELQKFLNLVFSVTYPIVNAVRGLQ